MCLKTIFLFVLLPLTVSVSTGQVIADDEATFDSLYAVRIELEEIEGVYIPADLDDAFQELLRLSSDADIEAFSEAEEATVRDKLHFGLGRWMIYNWGFYGGSRLSHYLTGLGLEHPDDMAKFLLVSFHRYLNDIPLGIDEQVAFYKVKRELERDERARREEVIHTEVRKKKGEN